MKQDIVDIMSSLLNFMDNYTFYPGIKDILIAICGIFGGWLITRNYSRGTDRSINALPHEIKESIKPIVNIVQNLEVEFGKLTKYYCNISKSELDKLSAQDINNTFKPILHVIDRIDTDLNEDHIGYLIDKAFVDNDTSLLKRAMFWGSLAKLDGDNAVIAFQELSEFPAEIFRENLDYVLANLLKLNSSNSKIFLLTLLRNKLSFRDQ